MRQVGAAPPTPECTLCFITELLKRVPETGALGVGDDATLGVDVSAGARFGGLRRVCARARVHPGVHVLCIGGAAAALQCGKGVGGREERRGGWVGGGGRRWGGGSYVRFPSQVESIKMQRLLTSSGSGRLLSALVGDAEPQIYAVGIGRCNLLKYTSAGYSSRPTRRVRETAVGNMICLCVRAYKGSSTLLFVISKLKPVLSLHTWLPTTITYCCCYHLDI